jgi:DNA-binding transcriptional ArsR family regulator
MRLRILQALQDAEKPVGDIVSLLETSQPNISKHLKALCGEGLVNRRQRASTSVTAFLIWWSSSLAEWDAPSATRKSRSTSLLRDVGNGQELSNRISDAKGNHCLEAE